MELDTYSVPIPRDCWRWVLKKTTRVPVKPARKPYRNSFGRLRANPVKSIARLVLLHGMEIQCNVDDFDMECSTQQKQNGMVGEYAEYVLDAHGAEKRVRYQIVSAR